MPRVTRRSVLKLAAASAAAATAGCDALAPPHHDPSREKENAVSPHAADHAALSLNAPDALLSIAQMGFPWQTHDPFIACMHHDDHYPAGNEQMGPAASLDGRDLGQDFAGKDGWRMYHGLHVPGFPQHPHRGFETVTVVRRGLLDHSDSMGATARYGGGDVQWLTAGKGIQHAEMFPLLQTDKENPLELFQLWLNLPIVNKMVDPYFSMLWNDTIPKRSVRDAAGKSTELAVIAGRYEHTQAPSPPPNSWASQPGSDLAIWTLKLEPGARFTLPAAASGSNRSLYYFRGTGLRIAGQPIPDYHETRLRADRAVTLEAGKDESELLLLQGRPIAEPVVQYGPFVMSTREEIRKAYEDYQRTQFGGWPWPSQDPVHPREQGRFARRPDGRIERPA